MGPMSLDMRNVQETTGPVGVPDGMGAVEEFVYASNRTSTPIKIPLPGPFALTTFIRPVEHYTDRTHLAEAFVPALNHEIKASGGGRLHVDPARRAGDTRATPPTTRTRRRTSPGCSTTASTA